MFRSQVFSLTVESQIEPAELVFKNAHAESIHMRQQIAKMASDKVEPSAEPIVDISSLLAVIQDSLDHSGG